MTGEFNLICQGKKCNRSEVVVAIPRCSKCNLSAMLCENCIGEHDCKAAKEEKEWWDRHPD